MHSHTNYKKKHSRFVYVMESQSYLKVGISYDPKDRLIRLHGENSNHIEKFVLLKYIDCLNGDNARLMEKHLLNKFKQFQVKTDLYGAKTECFSKEVKVDLLAELDDLDCYQDFDPLLTCTPKILDYFLKLNNLNLYDICVKLVGRCTDLTRDRVKNSLLCILANISIAGGNTLVYTRDYLDNLSTGGVFCYRLIESMFSCNGFISANGFILPEDIKVKYDNRCSKKLKTFYALNVLRSTYLLGLYSYKNNLNNYLTRLIEDIYHGNKIK